MADVFPLTWRTVVVDDRGVAQYPAPQTDLEDAVFCDRTVRAFLDYEVLRRKREEWLHVREEGEREFLLYALDPLNTRDELPDPPPEMALPKYVSFAVLLQPQSMSQGWITRHTDLSRNGARVWQAMQRYDAALLVCMNACFRITHKYSAHPTDGVSPVAWLLHLFDAEEPMAPAPTAADELTLARLRELPGDAAPLRVFAEPPTAAGIAVLRSLFEAFMPQHMREAFGTIVWNTVRYAVSEMMLAGSTANSRAWWLLRWARSGLLTHFIHHNEPTASAFATEAHPIWRQWAALEPHPDALAPGTARNNLRRDTLRHVRSLLFPDEQWVENGAPVPIPPIVKHDQKRRAMSAFYTQATAPLVIAAACAVGYLRATINGRVLPGTDVPGSEPIVARAPRTSAESLRALTSYTLMRLHATMAGHAAGPYQGEHSVQWHPAELPNLVGPDLRVTAEKLLRTWQKTTEPDRHTWIRALEAALLFMVGE